MSEPSAVVRVRVRPGVSGTGADDLAGVSMICGGDDESFAVLLREVEGCLDRLVEVDGLTDLTARVGCVILLVDARPLDLEEKALVIVEQIDGLVRQLIELRHVRGALRVVLALHGRFGAASVGGLRSLPANGEIALCEETEYRCILVRLGDGIE